LLFLGARRDGDPEKRDDSERALDEQRPRHRRGVTCTAPPVSKPIWTVRAIGTGSGMSRTRRPAGCMT
jgi:hypothetical protein